MFNNKKTLFVIIIFTWGGKLNGQVKHQLGLNFMPNMISSIGNIELNYQRVSEKYRLNPMVTLGINPNTPLYFNYSENNYSQFSIKCQYIHIGFEYQIKRIWENDDIKRRNYFQFSAGYSNNIQSSFTTFKGSFYPDYHHKTKLRYHSINYCLTYLSEYRINSNLGLAGGIGMGYAAVTKSDNHTSIKHIGGISGFISEENYQNQSYLGLLAKLILIYKFK